MDEHDSIAINNPVLLLAMEYKDDLDALRKIMKNKALLSVEDMERLKIMGMKYCSRNFKITDDEGNENTKAIDIVIGKISTVISAKLEKLVIGDVLQRSFEGDATKKPKEPKYDVTEFKLPEESMDIEND